MRRLIPILTVALLSSWAQAQAGDEKPADAAPAAAKAERSGGDCMFSRTISDWQVLDNETLIVWAPTKKTPFLVKLWQPTFGLKSEISLGFEDRNNDGQFCDYGQDSIVVSGAVGPERVNIRTIRRIEEAEAKELIEGSKQKKKEEPAVEMPEQSDMKSDKK